MCYYSAEFSENRSSGFCVILLAYSENITCLSEVTIQRTTRMTSRAYVSEVVAKESVAAVVFNISR